MYLSRFHFRYSGRDLYVSVFVRRMFVVRKRRPMGAISILRGAHHCFPVRMGIYPSVPSKLNSRSHPVHPRTRFSQCSQVSIASQSKIYIYIQTYKPKTVTSCCILGFRYAFTVTANIIVYSITLVVLHIQNGAGTEQLGPGDAGSFQVNIKAKNVLLTITSRMQFFILFMNKFFLAFILITVRENLSKRAHIRFVIELRYF